MPEVILIGAGAAGSSAAWVCARSGLDTLLLTDSLDTVFQGEADSGTAAQQESQVDVLAAVGSAAGPRPVRERHRQVRWLLEQQPGLHLLQASASQILVEDGRVTGVRTWEGPEFTAQAVGLCVGSFLDARLSQGTLVEQAGKPGQMSYPDLKIDLEGHGLRFEDATYEFLASSGPGRVVSQVLAAGQLEDGVWLKAPSGLAAAGYVIDPTMDFLAAARAGQRLGRAIVAALRPDQLQ